MPELSQTDLIKSNIATLQKAILDSHPQMPTLLREIHRQLKEDPATVTLLEEEEIAVVVRGLELQTNTFIAQSMTKTSSAAKTKALKNVSAADLGF